MKPADETARSPVKTAVLGAVVMTAMLVIGLLESERQVAVTSTRATGGAPDAEMTEGALRERTESIQGNKTMLTKASHAKSVLIGAIVLGLGWQGMLAAAPERRYEQSPAFMSGDADEAVVLPPMVKLSEKEYPAIVGAFKPGSPAGSKVGEDGVVAYQDAKPAMMTIAWLDNGKARRDDDGNVIGMYIVVPESCVESARGWIGHALPVKETEWRLSNGDVRSLRDKKAALARVCDASGPDAKYDRDSIAGAGDQPDATVKTPATQTEDKSQ